MRNISLSTIGEYIIKEIRIMDYRIMKKYILYILVFGSVIYVNYLIRKGLCLSTDIFTMLLPGAFGFGIVWLYNRIKNKETE